MQSTERCFDSSIVKVKPKVKSHYKTDSYDVLDQSEFNWKEKKLTKVLFSSPYVNRTLFFWLVTSSSQSFGIYCKFLLMQILEKDICLTMAFEKMF